jgi:predicted RecA/RadA family phage recombinase
MNKPASGEEVEFAYDGVVKIVAATSTIAIGDRVYSNTTGKATDAGTTDNGFCVGRAITASAAANDIITIKLFGDGGSRY